MIEPVEYEVPVRLVSESNMREHWAKKAARAKKNRSAAKFWTEQKVRYSHMGEFIVGGAPLKVTITRIAPGKLDDDNLTGSAKHVRDGIADALGIDDGDPRITWVVEQAKFTGTHRGGYSCAVRIEVRESE